MMASSSTEFWIILLFFITISLLFFLMVVLRKMNRLNAVVLRISREQGETDIDPSGSKDAKQAKQSARDIIDMLHPLVEESRETALRFDEQVTEKKRLLKELNDALDSRVISINLLLSRADALQKKLEKNQEVLMTASSQAALPIAPFHQDPVLDQQNQIIALYQKKIDLDTIARRLSIPKGEVKLVIDLKKKFLEMEKQHQ